MSSTSFLICVLFFIAEPVYWHFIGSSRWIRHHWWFWRLFGATKWKYSTKFH